jgi:TetR/AcrR family transcriptional regulator
MREKQQETVLRILEVATDVFAEVGFTGARMDEIAGLAQVNKATLYYHIGDKEALYTEVLHRTIGGTVETLLQRLKKDQSPEEKLKTYIHTIIGSVERNPQMPRIIMRELASGSENISELLIKHIAAVIGILGGILNEGVKKGVFSETSPLIVHMMVMGCLLGYGNLQNIQKRHPEIKKFVTELDKKFSADISGEIEKLILKAIRD